MDRKREGERNEKINIESTNLSLHEVIWFPTVASHRHAGKLHSMQSKVISFDL